MNFSPHIISNHQLKLMLKYAFVIPTISFHRIFNTLNRMKPPKKTPHLPVLTSHNAHKQIIEIIRYQLNELNYSVNDENHVPYYSNGVVNMLIFRSSNEVVPP